MPLPTIPVSPFPNVPNAPGVPQIARSPTAPVTPTPSLGTGAPQGTLWQSSQVKPKWGILDSTGKPVITPDSFINFDNRNEWVITNAPVQAGAFASYNKTIVPYDVALRLRKGGTLQTRTEFLKQIERIAGDTNLYTVLTPEKSYPDVNVVRFEVTRRGVHGAYLLAEVDIFFKHVQQVTAQYSTAAAATQNAQTPAAQPPVNQGRVQPAPVNFIASQQASQAITQALNPNAGL